jgi:beta-lactamase superfamily II metal-dependent hydrolase
MDVSVSFLDVGEADCTIAIDHEAGKALVIDCPAGRAGLVRTFLQEQALARIDLALITHSHSDHAQGIFE